MDRFQPIIGMPPMAHGTDWRMKLARRMIADPGLLIEQVAADLGHARVAAFARAYKKIMGETLAAERRRVISIL